MNASDIDRMLDEAITNLFGEEGNVNAASFISFFTGTTDQQYSNRCLLFGHVQRNAFRRALETVEGWAAPFRHEPFSGVVEDAAAQLIPQATHLTQQYLRLGYQFGMCDDVPVKSVEDGKTVWEMLPRLEPGMEVYFEESQRAAIGIEVFLMQHLEQLEHYVVHSKGEDHQHTWQTVLTGFTYGLYMVLLDWWVLGLKTAELVQVTEEMESSLE